MRRRMERATDAFVVLCTVSVELLSLLLFLFSIQ